MVDVMKTLIELYLRDKGIEAIVETEHVDKEEKEETVSDKTA